MISTGESVRARIAAARVVAGVKQISVASMESVSSRARVAVPPPEDKARGDEILDSGGARDRMSLGDGLTARRCRRRPPSHKERPMTIRHRLRRQPPDPPRAAQGRRRRARGAVGRHARARPDAEIGRHAHLRPDDRGDRARPAARPGVLAQPALAADVQPARPLRRRHEPRARAGRVVGGEQGRPHLDLQAAPGRQVPRRAGADVGATSSSRSTGSSRSRRARATSSRSTRSSRPASTGSSS